MSRRMGKLVGGKRDGVLAALRLVEQAERERAVAKAAKGPRMMRSYDRLDVRNAQSDLSLLYELDQHAFDLVTAFTKTWIDHLLNFEEEEATS